MKKIKLASILLAIAMIFCLVGCAESEENLNNRITELKTEITQLENQKSTLEKEVTDIKVEKGVAKYVVTFEIRQRHYGFDFEQHMKDEMNAISIQIPVDKEYYDKVEVGDIIDDSFRMGSMVMKGSFGSWEISVEDKEIQ